MSDRGLWERLKEAHIVRALVVYLAVSWVVLQLAATLNDLFALPTWLGPITLSLLAAGLVLVLATAWVQSHPLTDQREAADEVPESWEIDVKGVGEAISKGELPHLTWARAVLGGVFAFALLFGFAGLYVVIQDRGRSFSPDSAVAEPASPAIAVMPFAVRGEGLEVWREGMVDALSTNLADVAGLRAINSRTVLARWKEEMDEAKEADLATVWAVAHHSGARYALLGNAIAAGPSVRFSADLYDVDSEERLEHVQVEGSSDNLLELVDELSLEVVRALVSGESDLPHFDLAGATTGSLEALKAFLVGESLYRRSDFEAAIESYEEAVAIDSTFAFAYFRLADSHGYTTGAGPSQQESLDAARKYDSRLPERERLLLLALEDQGGGHLDTFESLRAFLRRHPQDPTAWFYLGELYMHAGGRVLATAADAQTAFARVVALAPEFGPGYIHLIELAHSIQPDSARLTGLLADYLTVGQDPGAELAINLIYGDSLTRSEALATLDTFAIYEVGELALSLADPRDWNIQEPALMAAYRRADELPDPDQWRSGRVFHLATSAALNAGQLNAALAYMDELEVLPGSRTCATALIVAGELPVPEEFRKATLRPYTKDRDPWYCAALLAAASGRWDIHAEALENNRRRAADARASGDSAGVAEAETTVRVLEAYGLYGRGNLAAALSLLESDPESLRHDLARWLQARLYNEVGRPAEAIPILLSIWPGYEWQAKYVALANRELGRAYEAIGEDEKAIAAYAKFIDAWQNADPELQPWVDEAQARMDALWAKRN